MEKIIGKVLNLRSALERFIECITLGEENAKVKDLVLKYRARDIIETSITIFLNRNTIVNLDWILDSVNVFTRNYPDNVIDCKSSELNNEMDSLYYNIMKINSDLFALKEDLERDGKIT